MNSDMRQTEIQIVEIGIKLQAQLRTYSVNFMHYNTGSHVEVKTSGCIELEDITPIIGDYKASIFADNNDTIIRIYEPYTE